MCLGRIVPKLTHCYETLSLQFNEMFPTVIIYVCTFHQFNKVLIPLCVGILVGYTVVTLQGSRCQ